MKSFGEDMLRVWADVFREKFRSEYAVGVGEVFRENFRSGYAVGVGRIRFASVAVTRLAACGSSFRRYRH